MNSATHKTARFFVLGAGFSAVAGLPLSRSLLDRVLAELDGVGHSDHLRASLDEYLAYRRETIGAPSVIDIEDFAAYLDYEHFLGLFGTDGWSTEGNRAQLQLRWGIGRVLHRSTPAADDLPPVCLEFARRLAPPDVVVTFNYDRLLETALDHVGTPYRRFPYRYRIDRQFGIVSDSAHDLNEVLLLKVHGSLDWVSTGAFSSQLEGFRVSRQDETAEYVARTDPLFGQDPVSATQPLVDGPAEPRDPLLNLQVLEDLNAYYASPNTLYFHAPLILAPSSAKLLYGAPLVPLWSGLDGYGASGLTVVGYSLPSGDPYARQAIYRLVRSYTRYLENKDDRISIPRKMELVTLKSSDEEQSALRETFRFMKEEHTTYVTTGFDNDAVDVIFT